MLTLRVETGYGQSILIFSVSGILVSFVDIISISRDLSFVSVGS